MDFMAILAQAANSGTEATEQSIVPMESIWRYVTSLNTVEALTFISFGAVCLFYGWRVFKILVVICFGLIGLILGMSIINRIDGLNNQLAGGLIGMGVLAVLSVPLMRWAVSLLGALAGAILTAGIWYACNLNESYIWAGALVGMVAGGMISFIVFKISIILFSSLGGSSLAAMGALAILNQYQQAGESVRTLAFDHKWFMPVVLIVPTILGVILQNRFVKGSRDWNI